MTSKLVYRNVFPTYREALAVIPTPNGLQASVILARTITMSTGAIRQASAG